MDKIVECVPNFSEGRDKSILDAIAQEIEKVSDAKLLDVDPGADTNRTVFTIIGNPESIQEAAFVAIKKGQELIDMSKHSGAHPRFGACDVCPFIPVSGVTMDDCVEIAKKVGARVGKELDVPVYLYEEAASKPEWKNLAVVRKGQYEGLAERFPKPEWKPDFGPAEFRPKFGAVAVGAREFLIAYNVNLNTRDRVLARNIAFRVREAGRAKRDENDNIIRDEKGKAIKEKGKLKCVKGIGWYIKEYGAAQLSFNLTNTNVTPLHILFEESVNEAVNWGVRVTGSEVVGLVPKKVMTDAGTYYLEKQGKSAGVPEDELVHIAIKSMGLSDITTFDPKEKVIESFIEKDGELVSMTVKDFVNEVSMDSPAPGGGSVAALAGSLSAGLAAMVGNLTVGKMAYKEHFDSLRKMGSRAQKLQKDLLIGIDKDTDAFNSVLDAMRLPKKTDEEKAAQAKAVEEGYKVAAEVPLETAKNCLESMKCGLEVVKKGNKNSITDGGVAVLMGQAGMIGAIYNVKINFESIKDAEFKKRLGSELDSMEKEAEKIAKESYELVNKSFS